MRSRIASPFALPRRPDCRLRQRSGMFPERITKLEEDALGPSVCKRRVMSHQPGSAKPGAFGDALRSKVTGIGGQYKVGDRVLILCPGNHGANGLCHDSPPSRVPCQPVPDRSALTQPNGHDAEKVVALLVEDRERPLVRTEPGPIYVLKPGSSVFNGVRVGDEDDETRDLRIGCPRHDIVKITRLLWASKNQTICLQFHRHEGTTSPRGPGFGNVP